MKYLLFIPLVVFFSCGVKQEKKQEPYIMVKPGVSSEFGDFRITLNNFNVSNNMGYYGRADNNNKYIILNLSYTNISNRSKQITAYGILGLYGDKTVIFDDNKVVSRNYELTLNPGVTESIELAYKVPLFLNGVLDFLPDPDVRKVIQFNINDVLVKY